MAKTAPIKPEEQFARGYVDRLILEQLAEMESVVKLSELADKLSGHGVGLGAVRALLASNPERFAYHERKWIPAARLAGQGRPLYEAIVLVLTAFDAPTPFERLLTEIGRIRQQELDTLEPQVRRILERDARFIFGNGIVALTDWAFAATDESTARALALNGVSDEEFAEAQTKTAGADFRTAEGIAAAAKSAAPIRLKAFGAAAWAALNAQDPRAVLMYDAREVYAAALSATGLVYAPGGELHPEAEAKKWVATAVKLADRLAPTVEVEDAQPIEVKTDDVSKMVAKVLASDATVTATRLLEEFYEITPGNKTFSDDLANVMAALRAESTIQWFGGDRFRKAGAFPTDIQEVPEPFRFVETGILDEDGEPVDAQLNDDGLSTSLRKLLQHPLATDVLDEDPQPAPKTMPESLRLVLKSIHRELGTFPLAQFPTGWLDNEPAVQEMIWIDPTGRELQVWVNTEARLLTNLIDWWLEQPVESGAVFTLTKTARPNVYEFEWLDQPDPVVYISSQRMEELRNLGAASEGKSTLDILIDVMGHWPKGADFLAILAEVNVARRSSRRLVASLLSSYQCFYQRQGSPVWHFDAKKIEQGFDKTKRKFVITKK